ncbi:MAG: zinc-binding dehydrogenase [Candidatus Firestonebacteria bacterium]
MLENPTVIFKKPLDVVLENTSMPSIGYGEVLIQTSRTLISTGTELTILSGEFPKESAWAEYGKYPFLAGYSNIGVVVEIGEGVDASWKNQRVASFSGHSKYVKSPVESAKKVSDGISDEQAAFFTIAEVVMNGVRRGQIQFGESVVIYGLGLLGQLTAQFSGICGAKPVIGIDVAQTRLDLLPKKPSIIGVNSQNCDIIEKVKELTKGRMADVIFELTGNQNLIPKEFALLKKKLGRFIVLSSPRGAVLFDFHDLCNRPSFTIIGIHHNSHPEYETSGNPWTQSRHTELFFDYVKDGEIKLDNLISHRAKFSQAPELYKMLLKDRAQAMGVILEWE